MIDKVFKDEPSIYSEDVIVDEDGKAALQKDAMLYFPNATTVDKEFTENEESGQRVEDGGLNEEGWTTVIPRWR
ncbi:hypothetical protein C1H46_004271 [Malus baccata]|uniref:Uncharacterized protein n=1 Tax=Malus baccata TaxID=106549 RepID=A0A540NGE5_MALBA|nr:hypothetical protein C1H46_004271 [Malus baccata]